MNAILSGLTIFSAILILIPITTALHASEPAQETIDKWARFYVAGIVAGILYTLSGIGGVLISILLGMLA